LVDAIKPSNLAAEAVCHPDVVSRQLPPLVLSPDLVLPLGYP